ncbi:putative uridine nucleosidase 2 [Nymphaea thermarum]|nr:putative uridine nucleosidase 2 [Nymphaea thermarum]
MVADGALLTTRVTKAARVYAACLGVLGLWLPRVDLSSAKVDQMFAGIVAEVAGKVAVVAGIAEFRQTPNFTVLAPNHDAMAIFLALQSPELQVIGLTTIFGNVYTTLATRNALHLLEVAQRQDIPVAEGSHVTITSHHEGEIVRLPLPLPLESLRRRWSFCAATVAAAVSAPSSDLRRRSAVAATVARSAAAVARSAPAAASRQHRCLLHAVRCPVFLLLPCGASVLVLVMAEDIAPKIDVALDAGIAPKSENLPFQVTPIRLTKDNYLSWSAALEIGITSHGHLPYITGDKPAPSKTDPQWANWALEDSQVKVWIISSVSADIQPLILRKPTSFEMWNVLARMYGRKKRVLRTYQIKRSIYALKQGDLSVASYYAALKTKWEELDYHVEDNWDCGSDHARHWEKEWMDRTFLFLGGLHDEFESIRSQILNCDEIPGIEDVYARVESEEQRRQVMQIDPSRGSGPSAFVSRSSVPGQRPARRCTHCNKPGHSVDFCWDLHPEKRLVRGRTPSSRRGPLVQESNQGGSSSGDKSKLSQDQIKELQAYIGRLSTTLEDSSTSDGAKLAQALVATSDKGNPSLDNWIVDSGATHHKTGDPKMFQDYKLTSGQQRVSMADDVDDDLLALELWNVLAITYSQVSEARFLQLKRQFQDIKRETRSVLECIHEMKNVNDQLAIIGHPVSDKDKVLQALSDLGLFFDVLCIALEVLPVLPSFEGLKAKLIQHEASRVQRQELFPSSSHNVLIIGTHALQRSLPRVWNSQANMGRGI